MDPSVEELQTQTIPAPGAPEPKYYLPIDPSTGKSLRRCVCPMCRSGDVWKWGKPSWYMSLLEKRLNLSQLTCRRCGYKFLKRRVITK